MTAAVVARVADHTVDGIPVCVDAEYGHEYGDLYHALSVEILV